MLQSNLFICLKVNTINFSISYLPLRLSKHSVSYYLKLLLGFSLTVISAQLFADNTKLKYENGVIHFTTFNEANTKLFVAQSNFIQAKFQYHFKHKLLKIYSE